jgi:hypothetical protein
MKRTVPIAITFFAGALLLLSSFFPLTESWKEDVLIWFDILAAIAFLLGGGNLLLTHLRRISDRRKGWGYSGVILITFLVTLVVGFLKIGVQPAPNTEQYGAVAASVPLSQFPVSTTVKGAIPPHELPASVYGQLTADAKAGDVTFRGWMTESQRDALKAYELDAPWHAVVEELFKKSQPPEAVQKRTGYQAQLAELSFRGVMTPEDQKALVALSDAASWKAAVSELDAASNETHAVPMAGLPDVVKLRDLELNISGNEQIYHVDLRMPDGSPLILTFDLERQVLSIKGPMSPAMRDELLSILPKGPPLTDEERVALLKEMEALGPLSPGQKQAIEEFRDPAPTLGQRNVNLMFALLKPTQEEPHRELTAAQKELLTKDYDVGAAWSSTVAALFEAAHQTKYPWSGAYDSEGGAFWFIFEYGIVPLQSTMFALLGFFVASAAFRAFRAKNVEATLLLVTGVIILLGATYAGTLMTAWLPKELSWLTIPELKVTIMSVFLTAGNRAIMIGIALGIASTSLKILLGVDRSYLGSD